MARFARDTTPGALTHIVSKFADGAAGFRSVAEREAFLARVGQAVQDSDWQLLGYALMPDRIHWLAIAGETPLSRLVKPLHVGFALWLNRNQGHDGPVFADRPRTLESDLGDLPQLLAWLHQTPIREGFDEAFSPPWTSAAYYCESAPPPAWLRIDRVLAVCGLDDDEAGRARLAELVQEAPDRSGLMVRPSGAVRSALIDRAIPSQRRWEGELDGVLAAVSEVSGIESDRIKSTDRSRIVVGARRVAVLAGTRYLGRTLSEMAAVVGISTSSASRLVRTDPSTLDRATADAERVADQLIRAAAEAHANRPPTYDGARS